MSKNEIGKRLQTALDADAVIEACDMSRFTSFKTGGRAAVLAVVEDTEQLQTALGLLAAAKAEGEIPDYMVLGNGSNVLVRDGGYSGVMVKLGEGFGQVRAQGDKVITGAAASMAAVAKKALAASLTGFEFAGGIPGSIGGAVFMNAGAYDGEISQIIEGITVVSKDGKRVFNMTAAELELSYRHSRLQQTGDVAIEVTLALRAGQRETIEGKMKELTNRRNEKQPMHLPSAGSFFKRPQGHFAGGLIEQSGLKGLSLGGAQVSPLHGGFLVNNGTATATDIINLMELVQNTVYDKAGVWLEPEVRIVGEQSREKGV